MTHEGKITNLLSIIIIIKNKNIGQLLQRFDIGLKSLI